MMKEAARLYEYSVLELWIETPLMKYDAHKAPKRRIAAICLRQRMFIQPMSSTPLAGIIDSRELPQSYDLPGVTAERRYERLVLYRNTNDPCLFWRCGRDFFKSYIYCRISRVNRKGAEGSEEMITIAFWPRQSCLRKGALKRKWLYQMKSLTTWR